MSFEKLMKFKLAYKIFATLTLTSLLVVALMVGLIKFYVARNFADYVNRSLLERYSQVVDALAVEYKTRRSWQDIKDYPGRWQEILRTGLLQKDFDPNNGPQQPPNSENKGFSGRTQDRPSAEPSRRIQRLARRLALFDTDRHHIVGGRSRVAHDGFTLQAITVDGQTVGWLGLYKKEHLANPLAVGFLSQQSHMLYMIGGGILLLTAVLTFLLSRHLLAPVDKLMTGTQAIMSRRFDTRIEVESKDELGQLAANFNTMAQTLESYEHMRRQWISDIAHELRTPLSILRGEIEALKDGVREVNRDTLNSLLAEARHLTKIVNDLHELSLADTGALSIKKTPVNPAAIFKETLGHFKQDFADRQIAIENNLENQPPIHIIDDADRLKQLFSNLVENTLRYVDAPGILKIGQEFTTNRSILFFEDSGPGVPQGALDHLFDRLYRVREIRQFSNIPIIMITARVEEIDRLLGLELGADDYICKPFSPREVVARVKAIFRRLQAEPKTHNLVVGSISLDDKTHQVIIAKQLVNLTPNEFGLLKIMMSQPNRVFSRSELINRVQGYDFEGYDRTIDSHIKNLRKKIAQKLPIQEIISTVYGIGYKFIASSG